MPSSSSVQKIAKHMNSHHAVFQAYHDKLTKGELKPDTQQHYIVELLSDLAVRLENEQSLSKKNWVTGLFQSFLGGGKTNSLNTPHGQGLYLYGGVGRGKSTLMDLFFHHVNITEKRRVHFHEFMKEIHTTVQSLRQQNVSDPLIEVADRLCKTTKLLCFDEFYVNDITDAMILGRLFTALFERGLVCIMTSNRHPDMLYPNGLNRELFLPAIALIKERMNIIPLDGHHDYRMLKLEKQPLYVFPLNEHTQKTMHHHWQVLTDNQDISSPLSAVSNNYAVKISVYGREIILFPCIKGVLWVDFMDFFSKALAASDYLELAKTIHTLMISGIPKLNPEHRNEATRFRLLVDTLYEAKRCIIISAEVTVEDLYTTGHFAFDFERTASRLHEMMSKEYIEASSRQSEGD